MTDVRRHSWNLDTKKARETQSLLAGMLVTEGDVVSPRLIAGCDAAFLDGGKKILGALVLFSYPELEIVLQKTAIQDVLMPYVPGLLSFREAPVLENLLKNLDDKPDLVMFDGHGYAHPRRLGLASHLGLRLDIPSIGVAKSILTGKVIGQLGQKRSSQSDLIDTKTGERIGIALRTRNGVKPVYVSVGNHLGLEESVRLVLACGGGFKLPEPTRQADKLAAEEKKRLKEKR